MTDNSQKFTDIASDVVVNQLKKRLDINQDNEINNEDKTIYYVTNEVKEHLGGDLGEKVAQNIKNGSRFIEDVGIDLGDLKGVGDDLKGVVDDVNPDIFMDIFKFIVKIFT